MKRMICHHRKKCLTWCSYKLLCCKKHLLFNLTSGKCFVTCLHIGARSSSWNADKRNDWSMEHSFKRKSRKSVHLLDCTFTIPPWAKLLIFMTLDKYSMRSMCFTVSSLTVKIYLYKSTSYNIIETIEISLINSMCPNFLFKALVVLNMLFWLNQQIIHEMI